MATKTVKKKTVKTSETSSRPAASGRESRWQPSVVSFNPLGALSESPLCNFNPSTPSFGGNFNSMETAMNDFKNQYEKMTGDASANARQAMDMMTKSAAMFAKGAEEIMKTLVATAQESGQRNSESVKSLMASRTLNELAEAQNKLAQQNFDEAMSAATKISEMAIKCCTEAMEPLNDQMTKAMRKATETFAA